MEHEFEKIRNKVLEAEQSPVAWEKELVWSKIRQPERKNFAFYYAAASLLIASALFFYGYEITKQKEIELQLKVIELSIEKNKTLQAGIAQHSDKESIVCPEVIISQPLPQQKIKKTKPQKIVVPIIIEEQKKESVLNNTVAETEATVTPLETQAPIVATQVQPIIGGNTQGSSTTKDKKLKFRLLLPEENTETVPAAAETISFHSKIK